MRSQVITRRNSPGFLNLPLPAPLCPQTWDVYGDADGMAAGYPALKRLLAFLSAQTNSTSGIMTNQALFGDW